MAVRVDESLAGIDWAQAKADLATDDFDNGRSPQALQASFERSQYVAIARDGDRVVGMARSFLRRGPAPLSARRGQGAPQSGRIPASGRRINHPGTRPGTGTYRSIPSCYEECLQFPNRRG
jgi:hypothetical protein